MANPPRRLMAKVIITCLMISMVYTASFGILSLGMLFCCVFGSKDGPCTPSVDLFLFIGIAVVSKHIELSEDSQEQSFDLCILSMRMLYWLLEDNLRVFLLGVWLPCYYISTDRTKCCIYVAVAIIMSTFPHLYRFCQIVWPLISAILSNSVEMTFSRLNAYVAKAMERIAQSSPSVPCHSSAPPQPAFSLSEIFTVVNLEPAEGPKVTLACSSTQTGLPTNTALVDESTQTDPPAETDCNARWKESRPIVPYRSPKIVTKYLATANGIIKVPPGFVIPPLIRQEPARIRKQRLRDLASAGSATKAFPPVTSSTDQPTVPYSSMFMPISGPPAPVSDSPVPSIVIDPPSESLPPPSSLDSPDARPSTISLLNSPLALGSPTELSLVPPSISTSPDRPVLEQPDPVAQLTPISAAVPVEQPVAKSELSTESVPAPAETPSATAVEPISSLSVVHSPPSRVSSPAAPPIVSSPVPVPVHSSPAPVTAVPSIPTPSLASPTITASPDPVSTDSSAPLPSAVPTQVSTQPIDISEPPPATTPPRVFASPLVSPDLVSTTSPVPLPILPPIQVPSETTDTSDPPPAIIPAEVVPVFAPPSITAPGPDSALPLFPSPSIAVLPAASPVPDSVSEVKPEPNVEPNSPPHSPILSVISERPVDNGSDVLGFVAPDEMDLDTEETENDTMMPSPPGTMEVEMEMELTQEDQSSTPHEHGLDYDNMVIDQDHISLSHEDIDLLFDDAYEAVFGDPLDQEMENYSDATSMRIPAIENFPVVPTGFFQVADEMQTIDPFTAGITGNPLGTDYSNESMIVDEALVHSSDDEGMERDDVDDQFDPMSPTQEDEMEDLFGPVPPTEEDGMEDLLGPMPPTEEDEMEDLLGPMPPTEEDEMEDLFGPIPPTQGDDMEDLFGPAPATSSSAMVNAIMEPWRDNTTEGSDGETEDEDDNEVFEDVFPLPGTEDRVAPGFHFNPVAITFSSGSGMVDASAPVTVNAAVPASPAVPLMNFPAVPVSSVAVASLTTSSASTIPTSVARTILEPVRISNRLPHSPSPPSRPAPAAPPIAFDMTPSADDPKLDRRFIITDKASRPTCNIRALNPEERPARQLKEEPRIKEVYVEEFEDNDGFRQKVPWEFRGLPPLDHQALCRLERRMDEAAEEASGDWASRQAGIEEQTAIDVAARKERNLKRFLAKHKAQIATYEKRQRERGKNPEASMFIQRRRRP